MQSGTNQGLVAARQRGDRADDVAIVDRPVSARGTGQGKSEADHQGFAVIDEAVSDFYIQKEFFAGQRAQVPRPLVLPGLLQPLASGWAVERDLAFPPTALRADSVV